MTAAPPALDAATILSNARKLAPQLRERSEAIETARRLPEDVFESLVEAGVLRIAMPRAWGGPELTPMEQIELIEILSEADASVGWCASILSDSGFYGARLEDRVGRELFGALDVGCAGMVMPAGRAERVDGGLRVNGHWAFGSGSLHAKWLCGGCLITENGVPIAGPDGAPDWRLVLFAPEDVEILDTWYTTGLAGSGSNDYRVEDLLVPEERSFSMLGRCARDEPLYRYHGLFFANVPGVPLGLARRALDEAYEVAGSKPTPPSMKLLREDVRVQEAFGEAEGHLRSARSYCYDTMSRLWDMLCAGDDASLEMRAELAVMLVHTGQSTRRVIDLACEIAGSTALFRKHPLERIRRDSIAVSSHVVHQQKTFSMAGRILVGLEPGQSFF